MALIRVDDLHVHLVGPVVLAIAYTQLSAWIAEQDVPTDAGTATPAGTEGRVGALPT